MEKGRVLYLDIIKIVSALLVILIHLISIKWYVIDLKDANLLTLNFFNTIARVSVPIFVMISGYFMLNRFEILTFKTILYKYILRIILIFATWSIIYAILSIAPESNSYSFIDLIKQLIYRTIRGPIHFWYLIMLIGLYLTTPFIQIIIKDKKLEEAFILIAFIMGLLVSLREVIVIDTIELYLLYMYYSFTSGYVIYYVLGHYLNTYTLSKSLIRIIYLFGILSFVYTFSMTLYYSYESGIIYDGFFGYLRPNTIISSVATLILFKRIYEKILPSDYIRKIITFASKLNFGVFIVHIIFVNIVGQFGLMDLGISYLILLPLYTFIIYVLSLFMSYLISKIKLIKDII